MIVSCVLSADSSSMSDSPVDYLCSISSKKETIKKLETIHQRGQLINNLVTVKTEAIST